MEPIDRAKRCPKCNRKPVFTVGTHKCRVTCQHCKVGTKQTRGYDKAVERWNAREIESLPTLCRC